MGIRSGPRLNPAFLFGQVGHGCFGGSQVVGGGKYELRASDTSRDADLVKKFNCFVGEDGIGLFCTEDGDSAADVPGERLHFLQRDHFCLSDTRSASELFEIQFGVAGDDGEKMASGAIGGEQSLKNLLDGHFDFLRDSNGGQIFRIDFVFA